MQLSGKPFRFIALVSYGDGFLFGSVICNTIFH